MASWKWLLTLFILAPGCTTPQHEVAMQAIPPYQPTNLNRQGGLLPPDFVRVVVMPVWYTEDDWPFLEGLDETLTKELAHTGRFEVVQVSRADLQKAYGKTQFSSTGLLPANLIETLRQQYAADGVLLTDLTLYEPYRPVAIGLRMKLLDLRSGNIPWAIDTVYNTGDPAVISGARGFQMYRQTQPYPLDRGLSILRSPTQFSRYAIWQSYQTLPGRRGY